MKKYLKMAWTNLKHRKIRSWLTIVGILIGIATVVGMISIGSGLDSSVNAQFEKIGTDKIIVTPKGGFFGVGSQGIFLTEQDLKEIKRTNGVYLAGAMDYKMGRVKSGDETKYTWIIGFPLDESHAIITGIQSFNIEKGRDLKKNDNYKAIVGSRFAKNDDFFKKKVVLGDKLYIEGVKFEVVGIMEPIGNPQDDAQVWIGMDVAREIFGGEEEYSMIIVQAKDKENVEDVAKSIEKNLRRLRDVKEGDEDFSVQTSEQMIEIYKTILNMVAAFLVGIGAISLLVGGVGIMNTMYTATLQRTKEIGTMKAIGAARHDILLIFIIEAGMLGLIGGAIGTIAGVGIGIGAEYAAMIYGLSFFEVAITPGLIFGALIFSFLIGAISGALPAMQAARLNPVIALRYE